MTDLIHKHKGLSSPCGWAIPLCGRWLWPLGHWRLVSARGPPRVLGAMTGYITTAATVTQESRHTPRSALVFEAHNNRLHRRTPQLIGGHIGAPEIEHADERRGLRLLGDLGGQLHKPGRNKAGSRDRQLRRIIELGSDRIRRDASSPRGRQQRPRHPEGRCPARQIRANSRSLSAVLAQSPR
jgi:hypothetical protein